MEKEKEYLELVEAQNNLKFARKIKQPEVVFHYQIITVMKNDNDIYFRK